MFLGEFVTVSYIFNNNFFTFYSYRRAWVRKAAQLRRNEKGQALTEIPVRRSSRFARRERAQIRTAFRWIFDFLKQKPVPALPGGPIPVGAGAFSRQFWLAVGGVIFRNVCSRVGAQFGAARSKLKERPVAKSKSRRQLQWGVRSYALSVRTGFQFRRERHWPAVGARYGLARADRLRCPSATTRSAPSSIWRTCCHGVSTARS